MPSKVDSLRVPLSPLPFALVRVGRIASNIRGAKLYIDDSASECGRNTAVANLLECSTQRHATKDSGAIARDLALQPRPS